MTIYHRRRGIFSLPTIWIKPEGCSWYTRPPTNLPFTSMATNNIFNKSLSSTKFMCPISTLRFGTVARLLQRASLLLFLAPLWDINALTLSSTWLSFGLLSNDSLFHTTRPMASHPGYYYAHLAASLNGASISRIVIFSPSLQRAK